jgi:hypothetical protein
MLSLSVASPDSARSSTPRLSAQFLDFILFLRSQTEWLPSHASPPRSAESIVRVTYRCCLKGLTSFQPSSSVFERP